jgi:hypothetical protein
MTIIHTIPCFDEQGNRYWKNEKCNGKCIQRGSKESMFPEVCHYYENRMAQEKDVKELNVEIGSRIEECSDKDCPS